MIGLIMFYGQLLQDKWIFEQLITRGFTLGEKGYFVDVGAFDGQHFSNSLFFEEIGWSGVCVEAQQSSYEKCRSNRKCEVVQAIVNGTDGGSELFVRNEVQPMLSRVTRTHQQGFSLPTRSLNSILAEVNSPNKIDYLSIDVEGLDFEVLQSLDTEKYDVTAITIEHNGSEQGGDIANWLWAHGYLVRMVEWDFFAIKDKVRVQ